MSSSRRRRKHGANNLQREYTERVLVTVVAVVERMKRNETEGVKSMSHIHVGYPYRILLSNGISISARTHASIRISVQNPKISYRILPYRVIIELFLTFYYLLII